MDATEGWEKIADWGFKKKIGDLVFEIWDWQHDPQKGFALTVEVASINLAYRATLAEAQELAHATAALWKGEG